MWSFLGATWRIIPGQDRCFNNHDRWILGCGWRSFILLFHHLLAKSSHFFQWFIIATFRPLRIRLFHPKWPKFTTQNPSRIPRRYEGEPSVCKGSLPQVFMEGSLVDFWGGYYVSRKITWLTGKISIFDRKYIFKMVEFFMIFHCHFSFRGVLIICF